VLARLDLALTVLLVVAPVSLHGLSVWAEGIGWSAVQPVVMALLLVGGVLGGAAFPVACAALAEGGLTAHPQTGADRCGDDSLSSEGEAALKTGRAASATESWDHLGAAVGALVTGVVLVPVCGVGISCGLLAGLKLVSGLALLLAARSVQVVAG